MQRLLPALLYPLLCLASSVQAAGFALVEQNASGLGNAFAGQAAVAADASTVFFNPAGLTYLQGREVVLSGHYIMPSAKFSDAGSRLGGYGNGGEAGRSIPVPNFYYAMDVGPALKFGLGVNAPFGLVTDYAVPWAGQTQALKSDLKTLNINPSLGWKVSDALSLGAGISWQKIRADLTQAGDATSTPTIIRMKGDDSSWGWNGGLLWNIDGLTRLGLAYRSRIKHDLNGTLQPGGAPISAQIDLPDSVSLSLFRNLNPYWDLLADATRTGWQEFDELRVEAAGSGVTLLLVPEAWESSWRYSAGLTYHQRRDLTWRFGLAYDQTPVPDAAHRTPRIPDADRTWLAVGGQLRLSQKTAVDFGYAHLFVNKASINHTEYAAATPITVNGEYHDHVDILSVQYTHDF
jgi:long-chain fatty acid transport protein